MLVWCSRRILWVSKSVLDMSIMITLEASISVGLQWGMYSHCLKHRWVGVLFYSVLSLSLLWRLNIWPWQRLWRRQFDFKGCLMISGLNMIYWRSIVIAWVLSIWQRTKFFNQGWSISTPVPLCSRDSWWEWHRVKKDTTRISPICLQRLFRE